MKALLKIKTEIISYSGCEFNFVSLKARAEMEKNKVLKNALCTSAKVRPPGMFCILMNNVLEQGIF